MTPEQVYLFGILFPLGLVLLGLGAYMYDDVQKQNRSQTSDNNPFTFQIALILGPITYLISSIKKRSLKGIFIGILFWVLFGLLNLMASYINSFE